METSSKVEAFYRDGNSGQGHSPHTPGWWPPYTRTPAHPGTSERTRGPPGFTAASLSCELVEARTVLQRHTCWCSHRLASKGSPPHPEPQAADCTTGTKRAEGRARRGPLTRRVDGVALHTMPAARPARGAAGAALCPCCPREPQSPPNARRPRPLRPEATFQSPHGLPPARSPRTSPGRSLPH